jgi:hypothetical protein
MRQYACPAQVTLNAVATGACLIAEFQCPAAPRQLARQLRQTRSTVGNLAMLSYLSPLALFGDCHRNHVFMNIKAYVADKLVHDPSPYA